MSKMNQVERMIPNMLEEYNLIINQDKTEMYKISRKSDEEWINVSIWDQCLVQKKTTARCFQNNGNILRSKKINEKIRICVFKTYLEVVFLYNSELWTLASTLD